MRLLPTLLIIAASAVLGGFIGHSQVLCADGTCVITGSWYGGAIFGGLLGMILAGACPACILARCTLPRGGATDPGDASSTTEAPSDR
jgi:hypothetical protein